jgi:Cof subfamily protein (haloacid dehalogenase superfamily)
MTLLLPTAAPALVVTDLDGTLLGDDGAVSPRNAAALARAADAGARVVIATGRPVYNLVPVIDMGFSGLAVCMNGAVIYDIGAGRVRSATLMQPDVMRGFAGDLEALDWSFALAVERATDTTRNFWAEEAYLHPWDDVTVQLSDRRDLLADPAVKMYVRYSPKSTDVMDTVRGVAGGRVSVTDSSGDGLLEVAASGVTKASALAQLAALWGIDAADAIAFGDMPNDLEMLQWAGRSVAMANAHADVAAVASEIGADHADDGVGVILERCF